MSQTSHRWLAICAAGVLAIGLNACHKQQTATDLSNSTDATAAAPAAADNTGAMNSDNAATNDMSSNTSSPPGQ